ncbi:MAG: polysaccharide deacetylase family protein [Geodermatophilaceae bacterium]|nr:polysaccharide deacetylase family protein [Geodermatophilaceae bacterium]
MTPGKLLVHVDVDSPAKLLDFYQIRGVDLETADIEEFHQAAWPRALEFFDDLGVEATFFVVADELEQNLAIQGLVRSAHEAGHEIENHTYSHPFGLAGLSREQVVDEIAKCNSIVQDITGRRPVGFRSPGYSMNAALLDLLEEQGMRYDSSAFWSVLNVMARLRPSLLSRSAQAGRELGDVTRELGASPYMPDRTHWSTPGSEPRSLWELPLPRLAGIPFYNTFNLWAPRPYTQLAARLVNRPFLVYLFHLIEFVDLSDRSVPDELKVHPNVSTPVATKLGRTRQTMTALLRRLEPDRTADFVEALAGAPRLPSFR